MKFYVNEFYDKKLKGQFSYGNSIIGLFKECKTDGRGSFCGYYGSEYYLETELYGYYAADCSSLYSPEKRISDVVIPVKPVKYDEVQIATHIWTRVIEAESIDGAMKLFANSEWRMWDCELDYIS